MRNILYNNKLSGYFCFIVCKVICYILDQSIYSNVYFIVDPSWAYGFDSQFFSRGYGRHVDTQLNSRMRCIKPGGQLYDVPAFQVYIIKKCGKGSAIENSNDHGSETVICDGPLPQNYVNDHSIQV